MGGTDKGGAAHSLGQSAERLLRRVASRQRSAAIARRTHLFTLVAAAAYLCVLLVTRLLGILPDVLGPLSLPAIPLAALLAALLTHARSGRHDAARAVDQSANTDDLFLTATCLSDSPGEYAPLVLQAADAGSHEVAPPSVIPFRWFAGTRNSVLALGAVALALHLVPTLDPFGYKEVRERRTRRRRELEESRKATEIRKAQLKKVRTAGLSPPVELALQELRASFQQMKPKEPSANMQRLGKHQQELGKLWRRAGEKLLPAKSNTALGEQRFGLRSPQAKTWNKQLSEGRTDAFRSELEDLQELAKKVAKATDPAERERLRRELKRRLQEAGRFASEAMGAHGIRSALARAMQQMNAGRAAELSGDALKAMLDSLELSVQELGMVEQALEDLQALEDALKALQIAQQCNQGEGLNGENASGCASMKDYAELYASLMKDGMVRGYGQGMKGPGTGAGGEAPEDDSLETKNKSEKASSSLAAGKILMQWQIDENAEPGAVREAYRQRLKEVKQGIDEAIVRERIPPGYHDGIRRYFDKLAAPTEKAE